VREKNCGSLKSNISTPKLRRVREMGRTNCSINYNIIKCNQNLESFNGRIMISELNDITIRL
jgi:hypothetical protein